VSVEQAAKPTFHIEVGDPVKIGDLTSSHIVYSVRTRVSRGSLLSPLYPHKQFVS
jgi:sorting nexin-1/2